MHVANGPAGRAITDRGRAVLDDLLPTWGGNPHTRCATAITKPRLFSLRVLGSLTCVLIPKEVRALKRYLPMLYIFLHLITVYRYKWIFWRSWHYGSSNQQSAPLYNDATPGGTIQNPNICPSPHNIPISASLKRIKSVPAEGRCEGLSPTAWWMLSLPLGHSQKARGHRSQRINYIACLAQGLTEGTYRWIPWRQNLSCVGSFSLLTLNVWMDFWNGWRVVQATQNRNSRFSHPFYIFGLRSDEKKAMKPFLFSIGRQQKVSPPDWLGTLDLPSY